MIGSKLSQYEVTAELGQGGMGKVYRARDTSLGRDVALKVLPDDFVRDPERVARFEREARTLATLQHPNIASIYGFDRAGEQRFFVMELVEGEDLSARIARGPIPVDDAITIAIRIARGLEAAHEQGVVHRDLKPANVRITAGDEAKILDFGLAKALLPEAASGSAELSMSPTITTAGTKANAILGTAAYMSPEQARGRPVDRRADIWAFGCVLYEMLAGRKAFEGDNITDILAEIVKSEPDLDALPEGTPAALRRLVWRCLRKDALQRLRDIGEARYQLEAPAGAEPVDAGAAGAAAATAAAPTSTGRRWLLAAAGIVLGAALGIAGGMRLAPDGTTAPATGERATTRFMLRPPERIPLVTLWTDVAISDDGQSVVYTTNEGDPAGFQGANALLALRRMDTLESTGLSASPGAVAPFFSPDGRSVGYYDFAESRLERVPLDGGSPSVIADVVTSTSGSFWTDDRMILHADLDGTLFEIPAAGGEPRVIATVNTENGEGRFVRPVAVHGTSTLVVGVTLSQEEGEIVAVDRESGQRRTVVAGEAPIGLTPGGHLVFKRGGAVMVQPLRGAELEPVGSSITLIEDVSDDVALSRDGTLVYRTGAAGDLRPGRFVWIDRQGQVSPALDEILIYSRYPRISPDGRQVAFTAGPGGDGKIWIYDLGKERPPFNVTFEEHNVFPVWSPDGNRLAYYRTPTLGNGRVFTVAADGSQLEPELVDSAEGSYITAAWTSQDMLILAYGPDGSSEDILQIPARGGDEPVPVVATRFDEGHSSLSPDERWLAYESDRSGRMEIWVQPYPSGPPVRVSSTGGMDPVWSRDGAELYFQSKNALMAVRVQPAGDELRFEPAVELFRDKFIAKHAFTPRTYDVGADGRFLMLQTAGDADDHPGFVVVRNWFAEVDRRVSASGE